MKNQFTRDRLDNEYLNELYNDSTKFSWTFDQLDDYHDPEDLFRLKVVVDTISQLSPKKILDNGCGAAVISKSLASKGYSVTGFDVSSSLLEKIKPVPNLTLVHGDSSRLPFYNDEFDCVVCSEVLEHIKDNRPSIKEMSRVLKRSGTAIITVPNMFCFDSLDGNFGIVSSTLKLVDLLRGIIGLHPSYTHGHNTHIHKLFPWQWKTILESQCLNVVYDKAIFISPYFPQHIRFIERVIYRFPGVFHLKLLSERYLSGLWPFKYFGMYHLFICKKI